MNEIFEVFEEFETDNLVVSDFDIKMQGVLVTNIVRNDDNSVSIWAGDPDTDKHAEELILDNVEKEFILNLVYDMFFED